MKIIKLPSVLSGEIDLLAINKQLKESAIQLDWSAVESANGKHLAILLNGLDLNRDSELLGLEGEIADNIAADVVRYFNSQPKTLNSNQESSTPDQSVSSQGEIAKVQTTDEKMDSPASNSDPISSSSSMSEPESDTNIDIVEKALSSTPSTSPSNSSSPTLTARSASSPLPQKVLKTNNHFEIREALEKAVINDLLGPAQGEDEEVDEHKVSDRYLLGLLAPKYGRNLFALEDDEDLAVGGGDDDVTEGITDRSIAASYTIIPSSMGMTFSVSSQAKAFKITAGWGQYNRVESEQTTTNQGNAKKVWKRQQIRNTSSAIPLVEGEIRKWVIDKDFSEVYVEGLIRKHDEDWIVSLFLVNGQTEERPNTDRFWLFQPELSVTSADPENPGIFIRRPKLQTKSQINSPQYLDEQAMEMLYRKHVEFAVGHGVSVHVDKLAGSIDNAVRISISVVPAYEVPKVTPPTIDEIKELTGLVLDMKELSESSIDTLSAKLNPLVIAYKNWIKEREDQLIGSSDLADYQDAGNLAISNCRQTLARIEEGINLLQRDNRAAESFLFMNKAMWQQRIHTLFSEKKRRDEVVELSAIDVSKNRSWYPFQLAFILVNLPSITDLHHEDRCHQTNAIADLLWFPTGGGKTEAYLGLTAYTLGLRRLQGTIAGRSGEHGVAVLMRYTLRLLTLQQFQRATALICACEAIRREAIDNGSSKWGREPFRIGLWVGSKTTPNKTSQSEEFAKEARGSYQRAIGSPQQLTNCPWCGTKIDKGKNIRVDGFSSGSARTLIFCGDVLGRCLFSDKRSPNEGLPAIVVDEEIYRRLPSLLIATVDKFAQMPWKGETQMLFGHVDEICDRHGFKTSEIDDSSHPRKNSLPSTTLRSHNPVRPPDLIIQDELHLISGPLGTLVGLYETVVDTLSSWEVEGKLVRPKVVASTATIRQAKEQIHNLFLRKVQVFPPQGIDVSDNFFARQREPNEEYPGRRYLGICAPGRRLTAALIRVYVAILAASQTQYEANGEKADPWMTLVGYFNSLRELAGMRRYVDDQIKLRLTKMDRRGLAKRLKINFEELTSRRNSTEIPKILDSLEIPFDPKREAEIKKLRENKQIDETKKDKYLDPKDILLATNMLSVGVDVKRLGVMVVANQPKNTAEYIQATSRVGRSYPGLVFTVFNWSRPRDLSHYEKFEHYHATFYTHVEALSITPFASGALERGLAALLVSLIRLPGREFNDNSTAERISPNHPYVVNAIKTITDRAWAVCDDKVRKQVEEQLKAKLDYWVSEAQRNKGGLKLGYEKKRDGVTFGLLKDPYTLSWEAFTCLKSLRNVEPTVSLILNKRSIEDSLEQQWQPVDGNGNDEQLEGESNE